MTLPYQAVGNPRPLILEPGKFRAAPQIVGTASSVAYFQVPLNELLVPRMGAQMRSYIKAFQDYPAQAAGSATVTVTDAVMIRSVRKAPAFPTKAHPDVLAFARVGGAWRKINVEAVNFAAGEVTVTAPVGNTGIRIAYLPGTGEIELRADRPNGGDTVSTKLYGNSLRALHETNQDNLRSAPTFGREGQTPFTLSPNFRLSVVVRSTAKILWDDMAENELMLNVDVLPIRVLNAAQLAAMAELQNRGGYV